MVTMATEAPQRHQRGGGGPTAARQGPRPRRRPRALLGGHRRAAGAGEHGAAEPGRLGGGWWDDGDGVGKPANFHKFPTFSDVAEVLMFLSRENANNFQEFAEILRGNGRTSPEIGGWLDFSKQKMNGGSSYFAVDGF